MPIVVLLDANIFVSALINPSGLPAKVIDEWLKGKFEIVVSLPLLREVVDVLSRPRIKDKYNLSEKHIAKFLTLIARQSRHVIPPGDLKICRDPDDDIILETALVGGAKYIVSRDDDIKGKNDLIDKMKTKGIIILTVKSFLTKLRKGVL